MDNIKKEIPIINWIIRSDHIIRYKLVFLTFNTFLYTDPSAFASTYHSSNI